MWLAPKPGWPSKKSQRSWEGIVRRRIPDWARAWFVTWLQFKPSLPGAPYKFHVKRDSRSSDCRTNRCPSPTSEDLSKQPKRKTCSKHGRPPKACNQIPRSPKESTTRFPGTLGARLLVLVRASWLFFFPNGSQSNQEAGISCIAKLVRNMLGQSPVRNRESNFGTQIAFALELSNKPSLRRRPTKFNVAKQGHQGCPPQAVPN